MMTMMAEQCNNYGHHSGSMWLQDITSYYMRSHCTTSCDFAFVCFRVEFCYVVLHRTAIPPIYTTHELGCIILYSILPNESIANYSEV